MEEMVRIHNCIPHTKVLGPGVRIALWFQGCMRKCPGCMSPETRDLDGGKLISTLKLAEELCKISDVEGITISGGEPFLQADALYYLLAYIKNNTNLGVIIYTGFTLEDLQAMNDKNITRIITELSDLIIDGEYIESLNDNRSMVGSSNQRLHFITSRYESERSLYEEHKRSIEAYVLGSEIFTVGVPQKDILTKWSDLEGGNK